MYGSVEVRKGKVLVVDDEQTVREMMRDLLGQYAVEVYVAENAEQALSYVEEEDFDLVFLDLKLFGMNGIELCRHIRGRKPLTILCAITGWAGLFDVEECREAGFDDFFRKPVGSEVLMEVVTDAIEKRKRWCRSTL